MMLIAIGFVLPGNLRAAAPTTRNVLIEASAETYWIARVGPDDQTQQTVSIVQSRLIGSAPQWRQISRIEQPIVSLAGYSGRLAVLLEDGQWLMLWDQSSSTGPLPEDGAKLIELGGDGNQILWAIALAGKGRSPTTTGATQPAATMPANQRLLYRLDQGRWHFISPLPAELAAMDHLSVIGGSEPLLAGSSPAGDVRVMQWHESDRSFADRGSFAAPAGTARIKFVDDFGRPALWLADEQGNGQLRKQASAADTAWSQQIALHPAASAPGAVAGDAVVAGGKIRLVRLSPEGKLLEYAFSPSGGQPQESQIPAVAAEPEPRAFEVISATAAALLVIVLVNTMRRRDGGQISEALETGALQLAPHGRRFVAGLIDALPWLGTMMVIFLRSQNQQSPQEIAEDNQSLIFIALAIYVLHTMVSEALWGWTVGKKLMGLRVVMLDQGASGPTVRAAVIRNLLRIVDVTLSFLPTLFVLVSPLRQRTGDIAANTIVVKDQPASETGKHG